MINGKLNNGGDKQFIPPKKVLVTGAGGFIATHLIESLVNNGADVTAFVRYNSRNDIGQLASLPKDILSNVNITAGDIRDLSSIRKVVRDKDRVFHLGALIAIPYSYLHPTEVIETNILGTLNVLQACQEFNVNKLIHTSTSEVYGTALYVPIDEKHPLQGQSPYSASKIGADKIVESYYRSFDLPAVTVRPFNTFGPGQSARAVIPTIISQALTKNTIKLGNLDARRDLTYVSDTVNGFIKAADVPKVNGEVFNLGTGEEVRIGDLAKMIIQIIGKPIKIVVDPKRLRPKKSEVQRLLSDNSYAKEKLGWSPELSLREGLEKTIEWVEKNIEKFRPNIYEV